MKLLNLGAGNRILIAEGQITEVVNHDISAHRPEINCVHNLNNLPWPWKNDEFHRIEFVAVIEHLRITPIEALNECWRILKKGGELTVKYPLWNSPTFHDDPTHIWGLSELSLDYVIPGTRYGEDYAFYSQYKWRLLGRGIIKDRNVKAKLTPIKP